MSRIRDYRPIDYRQVCAIARVVLLREPSITDAEWKAATLETCAKQGWDNPSNEMLARALGAVERSLLETIGPRPGYEPPAPPNPATPDKGWTAADYRAFSETVKRVLARSSAVSANVTPMRKPAETLDISEPAALDQFYIEAHSGDRLAALRRFAEIAIVRPAEWDYADVRELAQKSGSRSGQCYGCRTDSRALISHHVIQIQHGGSNSPRNRVAICEACHADVHPWLPKAAREARAHGWSSLAAICTGSALVDALRKRVGKAS